MSVGFRLLSFVCRPIDCKRGSPGPRACRSRVRRPSRAPLKTVRGGVRRVNRRYHHHLYLGRQRPYIRYRVSIFHFLLQGVRAHARTRPAVSTVRFVYVLYTACTRTRSHNTCRGRPLWSRSPGDFSGHEGRRSAGGKVPGFPKQPVRRSPVARHLPDITRPAAFFKNYRVFFLLHITRFCCRKNDCRRIRLKNTTFYYFGWLLF